jgi:hypothetical protein
MKLRNMRQALQAGLIAVRKKNYMFKQMHMQSGL